MARHARILTSIWAPGHFRVLSPQAQRVYMMLLSQSDLTHAGTLPLTVRRWASYSIGTSVEDIDVALTELDTERYVLVDRDTEEALVRTFVRNDGVWRQPNVMATAAKAAMAVSSPYLRGALCGELRRLQSVDMGGLRTSHGRSVEDIVSDLIETLSEPPPNPTPKGSPNPKTRVDGEVVRNVTTDSPSPIPVPPSPSTSPKSGEASTGTDVIHIRQDVERVCVHLADRIEENGSKRPAIEAGWRTSARLLLDKDGRTEDQVHNAIDWCQAHDFWRGAVMSMPKLRKQYDRLRLEAQRGGGSRQSDTDAMFDRAMRRAESREVGK